MTSNNLPCPITGCNHSHNGSAHPFQTITTLIRHLQSQDHQHSLHLLDHSICHDINLYTCTHNNCAPHPGCFFTSKRALHDHNTTHHPVLSPHHSTATTPSPPFTDIIFNSQAHSHLVNNWATAIPFILDHYDHSPPHFRSTMLRCLDGTNLKRFHLLHAKIIETILHSHTTDSSAPFWWLLFHLELLVLAPTNVHNRDNTSLRSLIRDRLDNLQSGNIEYLFIDAFAIRSRNTHKPPPHHNGNRAAQLAADSDNFRTAMARLNSSNPIAIINKHNIATVKKLYSAPVPHRTFPTPPIPIQSHHLPGDICNTIRRAPKRKGTGINTDSIDIFSALVNLKDAHINHTIQDLFTLVYHGQVPAITKRFFTDTYLFCLHKDPNDPNKLRPIGIPTAIRRIIASHIATTLRDKFAHHLLPFNYAVGVDGGMDFIIKAIQLSIERHIIQPQTQDTIPTRAALFIDLTNMFNNVSREELFDIIHTDFPELAPITTLIYDSPSTVHYKYNSTSWNNISMEEGVNQGCPLSSTFAALVMNRVLQPLNTILRQRAHDRYTNGDIGDDGFGGITHLFAWVDDISATVPLDDITPFLSHLQELGKTRGCFINPNKSRILTSCDNTSIIPQLQLTNPSLATTITDAINTYSHITHPDNTIEGIELTSGFRLLGTPVSSPTFATEFYNEQLSTAFHLSDMNDQISDLQTRLQLFSTCIIQKFPHLLSSEVMHHLPLDFNPHLWPTYTSSLGLGIHTIIDTFLQDLLSIDTLPDYAKYICHIPVNNGGLGLLFPRHRATTDYVITMTSAIRRATDGFRPNKDVNPTKLHPSITNLFHLATNPNSSCLLRYHLLLPSIAQIACPDRCPPNERLLHFQTKLSPKSMRSYVKKYCANILTALTYETTVTDAPEHSHVLPSILSPHTSYPLISMSRNTPANRLPNWSFRLALQRKLRLPIYDTTNPPHCPCGTTHDAYGDHAFRCKKHNKTSAHHFIRDGWAAALQPALALSGYINPNTQLQTEIPHLSPSDITARPFDFSFTPDPHPTDPSHCSCPYTIIGADVTITHTRDPSSINLTADVKQKLTAAADQHLQLVEKKKFLRGNRTIHDPTTNTSRTIFGEEVIGDLLQANAILIPIAIDPHGYIGPTAQSFLSTPKTTIPPLAFRSTNPNARTMHYRATTHPSPTGILQAADAHWKLHPTRQFYGPSHSAPTPQIHTMQQLGLTITKAFSIHLRNATRRSVHIPPSTPHQQPTPNPPMQRMTDFSHSEP